MNVCLIYLLGTVNAIQLLDSRVDMLNNVPFSLAEGSTVAILVMLQWCTGFFGEGVIFGLSLFGT